jgi:hypothetical protein
MKRTHYIYKLPWPGNVTFRICCGSWRGGGGSGGLCNYLAADWRHNFIKKII